MEGRPKFCPHCGASLDNCPKFCSRCGAHLPEIVSSGPTENPQSQNNPQQPCNNQQQQSYNQQPYNYQQIHNYDYQPYNYNLQQPYGYNGQPMYVQPKKNSGGLTAIAVITILLAVLAFTFGLADLYIWYVGDITSIYEQNMIATIGVIYILLFVAGLLGGIICARRKNWGVGLASFISALVLLVVVLLFDMNAWTLISVAVAATLLVLFIKCKQYFES